MGEALIEELRPIIRDNKTIARDEAESGKPLWNIYGNSLIAYERQLGAQEGESPLVDHISSYEAKVGTPYILDIGGDLSAIRSQRLPGIAIGLGKKQDEKNSEIDDKENRNLLSGDVLLPSTWTKLHALMVQKNIPEFSLVVSCMGEGLLHVSENPNIHYKLLQEMWGVLSSHNGMLAIQTTTRRNEKEYYTLPTAGMLKKLNLSSHPGIEIKKLPYGFIIVKGEEAPSQLPLPPSTNGLLQRATRLFSMKK